MVQREAEFWRFEWKQDKHQRVFLLHVFFPLIVGGLIYLLWRPKSLLMFEWANVLGLSSLLDFFRYELSGYGKGFPEWVHFSLPNALWVNACTSFYMVVWYKPSSKYWMFFSSIGILLALLTEFLQLVKIVPGTFCLTDLLSSIIFWLLSILLIKRILYECNN